MTPSDERYRPPLHERTERSMQPLVARPDEQQPQAVRGGERVRRAQREQPRREAALHVHRQEAHACASAPPRRAEPPRWRAGHLVREGGLAARLLYRRGMLELYVEDVLLALFLAPPGTGRVGLVPGAAAKRVSALRRWTMSLEY